MDDISLTVESRAEVHAMAYEIFTRKVRRVGSPAVTLSTLGRLALNKAAADILHRSAVEHVLLLWDAEARKFAVRPITKKDERAYKLHYGKKGNGAGFSAVTFLAHIGYDYSKTRSHPAIWNEDQQMFEVEVPQECFQSQYQLPKPVSVEKAKRQGRLA